MKVAIHIFQNIYTHVCTSYDILYIRNEKEKVTIKHNSGKLQRSKCMFENKNIN